MSPAASAHNGETGTTAHTVSPTIRDPGYAAWRGIRVRCGNPKNRQFKNYGGRGIGIAPAWACFEDFWRDMGPGWAVGLTIERVDNNGDYGPTNCVWASWTVQARNKRTNRLVATPWGDITVAEAAIRHGMSRYRIERRYGLRP